MSRVLKGVAVGVGLVVAGVAIAATGGAALGPILSGTIGNAFAVGGAIGLKGVTAGLVGGALLGGGLAAASYLLPSLPDIGATGVEAALGASSNADPDDYYVFGETFYPMQRVYLEAHGADDQSLLMVFHHASHEVESIDEHYHNTDLLVARSGGDWVDFPDGSLRYLQTLGSTNPAQAMTFDGAQWNSSGFGLAQSGWQFTQNQDKPDLITNNLRQFGKGAKNYDPRQDSTRGGSGSQRAETASTWLYGTGTTPQGSNLALVVLRYIIGEYQNGKLRWGIGANLDNIDYAGFIAAANYCDEPINSKPRHHIAGQLNCSTNADEALKTFMGHCGGWCGRNAAGLWTIYIPQNDLAVPDWTVTAQDCVEPIKISDQPLAQQFNTVTGRCAPKDGLGQLVNYPKVAETALVTEDGLEVARQIDFPFTTDFERAQYQARQRIRRVRFDRRFEAVLNWRYFRIQKNDTVEVNAPEFGYLGEVMRVVARTIAPDAGIAVVLAEESTSIYDQTEAVEPNPTISRVQRLNPAAKVDLAGFSLAAWAGTGSNGDAQDGLELTYNTPNNLAARTEVEYRRQGETDWISGPTTSAFTTTVIVPALLPQTTFEVRARHRTIYGVLGNWATGTVTTGNNSALNFDRITGTNKPEDGATRNAFLGEYDNTRTYSLGDSVFDPVSGNGYTYVNLTPSAGNPVSDGNFWGQSSSAGGGTNGDNAQVQYGPSASGPWSSTSNPATDTHIRVRTGSNPWNVLNVKGAKGDRGDDGLSDVERTFYRRSATPLPTPSGGSFDFATRNATPPSGWSATIPSGSNPLYATSAFAFITGQTGTANFTNYTTPGIVAVDGEPGDPGTAGSSTDFIFGRFTSQPATPPNSTGVPAGWFATLAAVPAGGGRIYVSPRSRPLPTDPWMHELPSVIEALDGQPGADGEDALLADTFSEYEDEQDVLNNYNSRNGSGEISVITNSDVSALGARSIRIGNNSGDDTRWLASKKRIEILPDVLYMVEATIERKAGNGVIFIGIEGAADSAGQTLVNNQGSNSASSQAYFAASTTLPPLNTLTTYRGFFKGFASSGAGGFHPNSSDPGVLRQGVRYGAAVVIVNWPFEPGIIDIHDLRVVPYAAPGADVVINRADQTINPDCSLNTPGILQGVSTVKRLANGTITGVAFDGSAITFPEPFGPGVVPIVTFGGGGRIDSPSLSGSGDLVLSLSAQNRTNTGFTPRLKLTRSASNPIDRTDTGASPNPGGSGLAFGIQKGVASPAIDGNYTFSGIVDTGAYFLQSPLGGGGGVWIGVVEIGLYVNDGSGFSLVKTFQVNAQGSGNNVSFSETLNFANLGQHGAFEFAVAITDSIETDGTDQIVQFTSVQYTYSVTTQPEIPATTSESGGIPYFVVAG
ncbi:MAG: hypothetical protein AAF607_06225 [Pseudomonadota bacterium]